MYFICFFIGLVLGVTIGFTESYRMIWEDQKQRGVPVAEHWWQDWWRDFPLRRVLTRRAR